MFLKGNDVIITIQGGKQSEETPHLTDGSILVGINCDSDDPCSDR